MKSIYDPIVLSELTQRLQRLEANTKALWGKMNAAQMCLHCYKTFEVANGSIKEARLFIGRILGPLFKSSFYNDKPWPKSTHTSPNYIISNQPEFEIEKTKLLEIMRNFSVAGEAACTKHPNPFYGKISPEQYGKGMYKHLDHHLKQFGL
jgi:hypothetical protein